MFLLRFREKIVDVLDWSNGCRAELKVNQERRKKEGSGSNREQQQRESGFESRFDLVVRRGTQ